MKSFLRKFRLGLKYKSSLSPRLFIVLSLIIAINVILIIYVNNFINHFTQELEAFSYLHFVITIYGGFMSILIIYVFYAVLNPLNKCETLLFEQYKVYKKDSNQFLKQNASLNEVIGVVIAQQKESWNRELTADYLRQKAELSQLQMQINPHFLYNTLESIRGFAMMKEVPEIEQMTKALSSMFRNNTRNIGDSVSLAYEIKNVENYILIQQFRFANRFTFKKRIDSEDAGILLCEILPLTIQPIVENAIYHGLETSLKKEEIVLWAYLTEKRLVIKVSDNGCGIPPGKLSKINKSLCGSTYSNQDSAEVYENHSGIALTNINQRIKMNYGNQYGITIASTVNVGTEVEITLPCIMTGKHIEGEKNV